MPDEYAPGTTEPVELLHPFYLDTDMSMAFAAALAGGVALEREDLKQDNQESEAVRNLRGNLRLFDVFGAEGGREKRSTEVAATESRLVRHHTEASIFITLFDELRRTNRIRQSLDLETLVPGQLVSLTIGPAIAPLRRVVDQIIRLLDVAAPFTEDSQPEPGLSRQQRREQARQAAKSAQSSDDDDDADLHQIRALFVALKDDLDTSGMIDVVVDANDGPSIVLTLDKRYLSDQAIELLHTSRFTVVGKVTQLWPTEEDFVNLHRRSVVSLVPALGQTVTWGMFALLAAVATNAGADEAERAAREAVGMAPSEETGNENPDEVMLGDAVEALNPAVAGPALQILPLAICA